MSNHRGRKNGAGRACRCICLAAALFMAARADESGIKWKVLGPGGGGAQFLPTISPHDEDRVLVGCDMTGSYISDDGGESWRMFNLRGRARFFLFDPVDPQAIYVQTVGLWRSDDGGRRWNLTHPRPGAVLDVGMPDDHAGEKLITAEGVAPAILALAVDPADSRRLYAAFQADKGCTLSYSEDRGLTWKPLRDFASAARRIYVDPRSQAGNRKVCVLLERTVAAGDKGRWREGAPIPGAQPAVDISGGFDAVSGSLVLYAVTPMSRRGASLAGGILVSRDGGASWQQSSGELVAGIGSAEKPPVFQAVATCLTQPAVAYVSVSGLRLAEGTPAMGVLKTIDFGKTWHFLWQEGGQGSPSVDEGGWVSERFGPGWGSNPLALGVAPQNPELCYATDYGRTLKSSDGGKSWKAVYTRRQEDGSHASRGLDVTTCYGVHHDPFNPDRVFISYTDIGLFRSENGGASWTSSTTSGVPRDWVNTTYWVAFDPEVRGRMWAAMSGTHDLPRPKMWRRQSPLTFKGGICRSDDGGNTWVPLTKGMPQTAVTHILLDPKSPAGSRVLYATGFGRGVFKSLDGGVTWVLKSKGLPAKEPFAWRLDLARDGALYLVVARRSEDGSIGNENDGALYVSRNGADSWERISLPAGVNGPNGILADSRNARRLYLAAWGRPEGDKATGGGVFLSNDAGKSWRQTLAQDQHIYDVTGDLHNPAIFYAGGFESSIYRSLDRGETWQRVPGFSFKWTHRVIADPGRAGMIFVTTFGGSVWYGMASGDSSAVEPAVKAVDAMR